MSEPPYKRPRRSGDDMDHSRDNRRDPRDRNPRGSRDYERESHRDRDRRNRSRSRDRGGDRDRNGGRGGRRDEPRERDRELGRERDGGRDEGGRRDEGRDRAYDRGQDRHSKDLRGPTRSSGDRERKRPREEDEDRRSRSPRRDTGQTTDGGREQDVARIAPKDVVNEVRSRTSTPPVAFKVQHAEKFPTGPSGKRGPPHQASLDQGRASTSAEPEEMDMDVPEAGKKSRKTRKSQKAAKALEEDDDDIVVEDDSMAAMQAMLGFGGFGSTHQKKVAGNDVSGIRKEKKTEYRQYMNRVGGFNRALSPTRES